MGCGGRSLESTKTHTSSTGRPLSKWKTVDEQLQETWCGGNQEHKSQIKVRSSGNRDVDELSDVDRFVTLDSSFRFEVQVKIP